MHDRTRLVACALSLATSVLAACGGEPAPAPLPPPPPPPPVATAETPAPSATASAAPIDAGPPLAPGPAQLTFKAVALPGATAPASLDYIAYEPGRSRVWVPAGGAGNVAVYDVAAGSVTPVPGFKTVERERNGKKMVMGPSAVAIGDGYAYVGNRASSEICPVDLGTLKPGACAKLASSTDGVAYVGQAKEVWVTTPRDQSIAVLDAAKPGLQVKTRIKFDGAPEGYATDATRGLFLTNLEDKNKTVTVDVKSHAVKNTWSLDCAADGPRGIAAESAHGFVLVACTDHIIVLDGTSGTKVATLDTGAGVDNIDWLESQRLLFVAAGKAAKVTVARLDDKGQPTVVATGASNAGARNGVADASGNFYAADPANAQLLVFPFTP